MKFFLILVFLISSFAQGESARNLVQEGNSFFAKGAFAKALEKYQAARVKDPETWVIPLSEGLALARLGRPLEALGAFRHAEIRVSAKAKAGTLENLRLQMATVLAELAAKEADPLRALELTDDAVEYFRLVAQTPKVSQALSRQARIGIEKAKLASKNARESAKSPRIWNALTAPAADPNFALDFQSVKPSEQIHALNEKKKQRPTWNGSRLDAVEDFIERWASFGSKDQEREKLTTAHLEQLVEKVKNHLSALEKQAAGVALSDFSPDSIRIDWLFLNLSRIQTKLQYLLASEYSAKGDRSAFLEARETAKKHAVALKSLLEQKLFQSPTPPDTRRSPLENYFSKSFQFDPRFPPNLKTLPKSYGDLEKAVSEEFNRFLGGAFAKPSNIPDLAWTHSLAVRPADLRPEAIQKQQTEHRKRDSVVLGDDRQISLELSPGFRAYSLRLPVDTVHTFQEMSRLLAIQNQPVRNSAPEMSTAHSDHGSVKSSADYKSTSQLLNEAIHRSPIDTLAALEYSKHGAPKLELKEIQNAIDKKTRLGSNREKLQREKTVRPADPRGELLKSVRSRLVNMDLSPLATHLHDLVKSLLTQVASSLERLDTGSLQRFSTALGKEPITVSKALGYLDEVKFNVESFFDTKLVKDSPLHSLIFLAERPELFAIRKLSDLEKFETNVLGENFEHQDAPRTEDSWVQMKRVFNQNQIPTHTIGDLSATRTLIASLVEAKKIDSLASPENRSKTREIQLGDDDVTLGLVLSAGEDREKGLGEGFDSEETGPGKILAAYFPKDLTFFAKKAVGFRVGGTRLIADREGVPPDPPITHVPNKSKTLWIRQGRSSDGTLKLPSGAVIIKVLVNNVDKTKNVQREARGDIHFLEDAKKGPVEITTFLGGKASAEKVNAATPAIEDYYVNKFTSPKVDYPPSLQKTIDALKKLKAFPGILSDSEVRTKSVRELTDWIGNQIAYSQSKETHALYASFLKDSKSKPEASSLNLMLQIGKGDCDVQNALLVHILNKELSIPARVAAGFVANRGYIDPKSAHGWTEYWDPGKGGWVTTDATSSKQDPDRTRAGNLGHYTPDRKTELLEAQNPEAIVYLKVFRCLKTYLQSQVEANGDLTVFQETHDYRKIFREYCPADGLHALPDPQWKGLLVQLDFDIKRSLFSIASKIRAQGFLPQDDALRFLLGLCATPNLDFSKSNMDLELGFVAKRISEIPVREIRNELVRQLLELVPGLVDRDKIATTSILDWFRSFGMYVDESVAVPLVPPILQAYLNRLHRNLDAEDPADHKEIQEWVEFWNFFRPAAPTSVGDILDQGVMETLRWIKQNKPTESLSNWQRLKAAFDFIPHVYQPSSFRELNGPGEPKANMILAKPQIRRAIASLFYDDAIDHIRSTGELPTRLQYLSEDLPATYPADVLAALIAVPDTENLMARSPSSVTMLSPRDLHSATSMLSDAELAHFMDEAKRMVEETTGRFQGSNRIRFTQDLSITLLARDLSDPDLTSPALAFLGAHAYPGGGDYSRLQYPEIGRTEEVLWLKFIRLGQSRDRFFARFWPLKQPPKVDPVGGAKQVPLLTIRMRARPTKPLGGFGPKRKLARSMKLMPNTRNKHRIGKPGFKRTRIFPTSTFSWIS
jgi:tetratricopeptide (TPR) repeat protein